MQPLRGTVYSPHHPLTRSTHRPQGLLRGAAHSLCSPLRGSACSLHSPLTAAACIPQGLLTGTVPTPADPLQELCTALVVPLEVFCSPNRGTMYSPHRRAVHSHCSALRGAACNPCSPFRSAVCSHCSPLEVLVQSFHPQHAKSNKDASRYLCHWTQDMQPPQHP